MNELSQGWVVVTRVTAHAQYSVPMFSGQSVFYNGPHECTRNLIITLTVVFIM